MRRTAAVLGALMLATASPVLAQEPPSAPDVPLVDVGQEARAQRLFDQLRCVVCQHEAIGDSPAGIAGDMRRVVRDEIAAGRTDDQILDAMVRRYGDYVLFRPPVRAGTWLLWFGPGVVLVGAGGLLAWSLRRRRQSHVEAGLSPEEERRITEVLASDRFGPEGAASLPNDGRSVSTRQTVDPVGTPPTRPISD